MFAYPVQGDDLAHSGDPEAVVLCDHPCRKRYRPESEDIPEELHDIRLDGVVTESQLLRPLGE